jgi:hypothetical protein
LVGLSEKELIASIDFDLHLTMIDGKVANAICNNSSSQVCNICGAKPTEMNDLSKVSCRIVSKFGVTLGLSPLHAWIRSFELIIHIGYRIDIKKWQVRDASNKKLFSERKKMIQKAFKEKLGLIVDQPKAGGSGTSNDGNTARRAFNNPLLFSEITGVDFKFIHRLSNILKAINSGLPINLDAFNQYCQATAKEYVKKYNWFYMPASVHKLLIHGSEIISNFLLPIGMFSEEAQECRNKDNKSYRAHHSRQDTRIHTMEDQFNHLLVTSDPFISSLSISKKRKSKKKISTFSNELRNLLIVEDNLEDISTNTDVQNESEESSDNSSEFNNDSSEDDASIEDSIDDENDYLGHIDTSDLPEYYNENYE